MKRCPECRRDYFDDTLLYCLDDGAMLLEGPGSLEPRTEVIGGASRSEESVYTAETKVYASDPGLSKPQRKGLNPLVVGTAAFVLLAIAGLSVYLFVGRAEKAPPRTTAAMQVQRLTGDGKTRGAVISPDGKLMAYIRADGGERSIWIKQIATNTALQIVKPGELDGFEELTFSPDGVFLYFNAVPKYNAPFTVYRVSSLGGTPTKAFEDAYSAEFSPDGKFVSFGRFDLAKTESFLVVANADGTNERKLASRKGTKYFEATHAWSPDGKKIAVVGGDDTLPPEPGMSMFLIPASGDSEPIEIGRRWGTIDDVVWHPSGDSLLIAAAETTATQNQIWEVSFPDGETRRLTNNLNGHNVVSITSDGSSLVTGELYARSSLWVSPDLKPENARQVLPPTGDTWGFDWTPDGRIVFSSDISGDAEIWVVDSYGSDRKQLTNDRAFKSLPTVSPDGRYIVYASAANGGRLERIDIGGGSPTPLTPAIGADNPHISTDGKWVLFSGFVGGEIKIMRVPIDGGDFKILTDFKATEPRYSRDGTRFACIVPNETSGQWNRLAIVPADGGPPIKTVDIPSTTNVGRGPVWTPDDSGITLVLAEGEKQNLWLVPVDGSPGKRMTDFEVPGIARREYSRDGKRIALMRSEGIGHAIMITNFR